MKTLALTCILPQLGHAAPVYLGNTYVGSIHSLNTVRPDEPECIQYYGKNAPGTATGASWDDPLHALNDVLDWHTGRDPKPKEVMYGSHLPEVVPCERLSWHQRENMLFGYKSTNHTANNDFTVKVSSGEGPAASQALATRLHKFLTVPPKPCKPAYWQGPALAGTNDCWDDE